MKNWMKPMPIIRTKFGAVCILTILQRNGVIDDWKLDEKSLSKQQELQHRKSMMPNFLIFILQGMTNNVMFTWEPLHTRTKRCDHEFARGQKKHPKVVSRPFPRPCSVAMGPWV